MILYLDTSSLIKLYVREEWSDLVAEWVNDASIVATSQVAYVEAMAAFGRLWHDGELTEEQLTSCRAAFAADWPRYLSIDIDLVLAGDLAIRLRLRGFDAIHVAAACTFRTDPDMSVAFATFDLRQRNAAGQEGLTVLAPPA